MDVKIKKTSVLAELPERKNKGDAGYDITCIDIQYTSKYVEYKTGLCFEIPEGYAGFLFPRSSISKYDLSLCNAVGVLDSSYRGEVTFRFRRTNSLMIYNQYKIGDRVGQIVIMKVPEVNFIETDMIDETGRGSGGYGSTGE